MALSEEEQRLLDELEASLAADDPRLANTLGSRGTYKVHRRRASMAGLLFALGIALLIAGLSTQIWALGLVGFVAMFAATVIGISAWHKVEGSDKSAAAPAPGDGSRPFMGRMEDRWRRRQNGSL